MAPPSAARPGDRPGRDGRRAGLLRRLRHSALARAVLSRLGAGYMTLVWRTVRWRVEGREHFDAMLAARTGFVLAIWHGRLFLIPTQRPADQRVVAMISRNRDGELIAAIVARFGIESVRGSSYDRGKRRDKGGREVLAEGEVALGERAIVALTPDGPRGPRMRAEPGVARLSAVSGLPIMLFAFSASPALVLSSWDRFLVPLPFGRGVVAWSEPIAPPPSADAAVVEAHRRLIETRLTRLTEDADRALGREPVRPAPAPDAGPEPA